MKRKNSPQISASGLALEKAIRIAVEAHWGQKDKIGRPYILHPLRLMSRVETDEEKMTAVLHDVIEDTPVTLDSLSKDRFPPNVLRAIDCLTKRKNETYRDFINRLSQDPLARRIKIADLEDNMDVRRLFRFAPKDAKRLAKYIRAWQKLSKLEQESRRPPRYTKKPVAPILAIDKP
jgi:(p)ppGpp synthase/HD superfamily hydrolase